MLKRTTQIPFTKSTSWRVRPLIHLLLTLRNITIVNKSLLMQALKQASTHPPRNANPSPTVSSHISILCIFIYINKIDLMACVKI